MKIPGNILSKHYSFNFVIFLYAMFLIYAIRICIKMSLVISIPPNICTGASICLPPHGKIARDGSDITYH